jgi:hypothetical protein
MKTLLLAGAALTLVAGANLSPAIAQAKQPTRWDAAEAMVQPEAMAQPVEQGATDAVSPSPRYEDQYHYGGSPRHPHWELQRVPAR